MERKARKKVEEDKKNAQDRHERLCNHIAELSQYDLGIDATFAEKYEAKRIVGEGLRQSTVGETQQQLESRRDKLLEPLKNKIAERVAKKSEKRRKDARSTVD